jgi:hypothetical protein
VKRSCFCIQLRVAEADALPQLLIDECGECRPQRRDRTRSTDDAALTIDERDVAGLRIGVAGHVGNTAADVRAGVD